MPLSCQGQNWQGGLALTLVDSLDTLALMNRCAASVVMQHEGWISFFWGGRGQQLNTHTTGRQAMQGRHR